MRQNANLDRAAERAAQQQAGSSVLREGLGFRGLGFRGLGFRLQGLGFRSGKACFHARPRDRGKGRGVFGSRGDLWACKTMGLTR